MFLAMSVFPLAHPSIRFHHFAPLNHAILLAHPYSDITTLIHRTIPAHRYPTCPSSNLISSLRFIALYQPIAIMFLLTCPPTWPLHWLYLLECDNALRFAASTGSEHHGVIGSRLDCTAFQQVHGIANSAWWIFLFDPLIVFIRQDFSLHHAL